jgi:site-specific DNA-methyltransferase (adenine-specific)
MVDTPTEPMNISADTPPSIYIQNTDGITHLGCVADGSVDLVLTDPPYIISRDSGMNEHYNTVKDNEAKNITHVKTDAEWEEYKTNNKITDDEKKALYLQYGTIYGKKYCVQTDYGDWDKDFTMGEVDKIIQLYYKKLRKGGTLVMFFDLWKIGELKALLEKHKFKQIRLIEWIKTNPQPLNSKRNYLTNCREIALTAVKGGKPTFNSEYDKGIYEFPLQGGKKRCHPTQKSLSLFEALIEKHSNEGDTVVDTFLGSGTTALACKNKKRRFSGCEVNPEYFKKVEEFLAE